MTAALVILWLLGAVLCRNYTDALVAAKLIKMDDELAFRMGVWLAFATWPILALLLGCIDAWYGCRTLLVWYEGRRMVSAAKTVARIRTKWGKP